MSEISLSESSDPRSRDASSFADMPFRQRSYWGDAWVSLSRDRAALAGGVLVLLMVLLSIGAQWFAPYDPLRQFSEGLTARGAPIAPNSQFLLGTDNIGRDLLSRLIWGGRISLTVSLLANILSILVAIIVGGAAGFVRGPLDTLVMRLVDIALSFPTLVLQIALSTVLPPSISARSLITDRPKATISGPKAGRRSSGYPPTSKPYGSKMKRLNTFPAGMSRS